MKTDQKKLPPGKRLHQPESTILQSFCFRTNCAPLYKIFTGRDKYYFI